MKRAYCYISGVTLNILSFADVGAMFGYDKISLADLAGVYSCCKKHDLLSSQKNTVEISPEELSREILPLGGRSRNTRIISQPTALYYTGQTEFTFGDGGLSRPEEDANSLEVREGSADEIEQGAMGIYLPLLDTPSNNHEYSNWEAQHLQRINSYHNIRQPYRPSLGNQRRFSTGQLPEVGYVPVNTQINYRYPESYRANYSDRYLSNHGSYSSLPRNSEHKKRERLYTESSEENYDETYREAPYGQPLYRNVDMPHWQKGSKPSASGRIFGKLSKHSITQKKLNINNSRRFTQANQGTFYSKVFQKQSEQPYVLKKTKKEGGKFKYKASLPVNYPEEKIEKKRPSSRSSENSPIKKLEVFESDQAKKQRAEEVEEAKKDIKALLLDPEELVSPQKQHSHQYATSKDMDGSFKGEESRVDIDFSGLYSSRSKNYSDNTENHESGNMVLDRYLACFEESARQVTNFEPNHQRDNQKKLYTSTESIEILENKGGRSKDVGLQTRANNKPKKPQLKVHKRIFSLEKLNAAKSPNAEKPSIIATIHVENGNKV